MRIVRDYPPPGSAPLVLTIGNFDGVHIGHQHLIRQVRERASGYSPALAAAMSFEPHPLSVLRPQQRLHRLGSCRDKLQLLQRSGLDIVYLLRFNAERAAMPAADFARMLFSRLQVRHLFVGENFRFGQGGRGDFALLAQTAAVMGAEVTAAPLLCVDDAAVSSRRIRDCLQRGDFAQAEKLLGRPWRLSGRVKYGEQRGRALGFPTANLHLPFIPPLRGIYAARATCNGQTYAAAVSIGSNPTVSEQETIQTEAHLLDFSGDLYGQVMELQPLRKLREEQRYGSLGALSAAIAADIADTRALLS